MVDGKPRTAVNGRIPEFTQVPELPSEKLPLYDFDTMRLDREEPRPHWDFLSYIRISSKFGASDTGGFRRRIGC